MPPVNRKSPSPVPRRRPVVAGTRTSGSDRTADSGTDTVTLAVPPAEAKRPKAVFRRRHRAEDIARLDSVDPAPRPTDEAAAPSRSRLLPIALGIAALLLIAAAVLSTVFFVHARGPGTSSSSAANAALVDAPATQQVGAATVDVLQKIYSYTYTTIDADSNAAIALMTPEMAAQYRPLFDNIRKAATQAKTTTKATVVSDGVRLLDGDRAEVLAFVVVTDDNAGTALQPSGYRFTASMLRSNGKWLLADLTEA